MASWREWLIARGLAPATVRLYTYAVFRLLTEHVQGEPNEAREQHVARFLAEVGKHGAARGQYARGLHSFFAWAEHRGYVANDPSAGITVRKARSRPPTALSEEELARLLDAAERRDPRRRWAIQLTFALGARRMEVAGIAPGDVQGDEVLLRVTKGDRPRRVALGPAALEALERLRPWYTADSVLGGVKPATVTDWARRAADDAGLSARVAGRPAHILRATFATSLLRQGVPVEVVRDLLGHESIATTNVYAVSGADERRRAVQRLPLAAAAADPHAAAAGGAA